MPLSGSAFWAVVLPVEKINLLLSPSGERGTFGWGTSLTGGGTIGTTSAFQQFGAWAGSCAPTGAANVGGVRMGTATVGNGTAYTASVYARGGVGSAYVLRVDANDETSTVASLAFTTGGTWHRYSASYTENSNTNRVVTVCRNGAGADAFYVDGAMLEVGSLTTYIDGDQEGCYWTGIPHQSQSVRSGTSRAGGSVVALEDLGLKPDQVLGAGMPPLETLSQSFALDPGSEFLNQRAGERPFVLTCTPLLGTTQQDYHRVRRGLIMALKADTVDPESPVRLWYTGGQGTIQIDAVLAGGFEGGERNGPIAENVTVRFIAHDPYWYAPTQQGTALAGRTSLGSTNYMLWRDPYGRWGTMGANGTTVDATGGLGFVASLLPVAGGTLLFGGRFGTVGGTTAVGIGMWVQSTNRFGTLPNVGIGSNGGAAFANVQRLIQGANGSVYVGGEFGTAGGTVGARGLAIWNGQFGTFTGGTVAGGAVNDLAFSGGTLFIGGFFGTAGGTRARGVAMWANGAFGTLHGGTISPVVNTIAVGLDARLIVGGDFTDVAGSGGGGFAFWKDQAWGTMGSVTGLAADGQAIAIAPSGVAYCGGQFTAINGGSANHLAAYNGVQLAAAGSGLTAAFNPVVMALYVDPTTSEVYVGGAFSQAGGIPTADGLVVYNGYAYRELDFTVVPAGTYRDIQRSTDGTLYVGGDFSGTGYGGAVAQIVNTGMADAYPTCVFRNTSAGTARIFQIANTYPVGAGLYFNYAIQPGEELTLTTEPGNRSFTSSFAGNIFGKIIWGSNLTAFRLMPGTNYLSFFADTGSVTASLYWTPRSDSFDGGTTY